MSFWTGSLDFLFHVLGGQALASEPALADSGGAGRRVFVPLLAGALCQPLLSGGGARAAAGEPFYQGVEAVHLRVEVVSDVKSAILVPAGPLLEAASAHLKRSLQGPRPGIAVLHEPDGYPSQPPDALPAGTLWVLIQVTVRPWSGGEPAFEGYLAAVGLRLGKTPKDPGGPVQAAPAGVTPEPLAAPKQPAVLAERILDAVKWKLDLALVEPLKQSRP